MTTKFFLTAYALIFIVLEANAQAPNPVWGVSSVSPNGVVRSEAIATDADGNVYVTGRFSGGVDFGVLGAHNIQATLGEDAFLVKYDAAGNCLWVKDICAVTGTSSTNWASGYALALDSSGANVYVTGYFDGVVDFDPSAQALSRTSAGGRDIYLANYSANGDLLQVKTIGGAGADAGVAMDIDGSGNLYLAGYFSNTVDFDPSAQTANLTSAGDRDIFLAKYNANFDLIWAKSMPGTYFDMAYSVVVDEANNVYLTGTFQGTVDFDPSSAIASRTSQGAGDIFLAKYNGSGDYLWAKSMGGVAGDEVRGLAVDTSGNLYIGGYFNNTLDLDPSAQSANFTSAGATDTYLAKYDANGNYIWGQSFGSAMTDVIFAVAVDAENNVYATGAFSGVINFNPNGPAANFAAIGGLEDVFIIKYNENGSYIGGRRAASVNSDYATAIAIDPSGNAYITGLYGAGFSISSTIYLPLNSNSQMHLIKYESCIISIPDTNFRNYLLSNPNINTNGDNLIHCNEARVFAGSINCNNLNIADFTGLQAFANISGLAVNDNQLTSLDVSHNTAITHLSCGNNQLTSLDVSHNTAITHLFCSNNQIANLDLSNNTALEGLKCRSNQLTSLNLSLNAALDSVDIRNNQLRSLNLANGNNTNLQELWIYTNPDLHCVQVDDSLYSAANWINGVVANDEPYLFDAGLRFGEACTAVVPVNQISASNANILAIYPNPSSAVLNVETTANITVSVVNLLGENILSQQLNLGNNTIDISRLASGVYFLKNENGRALRFVKE